MTEKIMNEKNWPEFLGRDQLVEHLHISLEEASPGYAKTSMVVEDCHLNGLGFTQGGAVFTLADYAFAAASNAWGTPSVGIANNISYIKSTPKGAQLTAVCHADHQGGRIGQYTISVTDETGDLVAKCTATSCRVKQARK